MTCFLFFDRQALHLAYNTLSSTEGIIFHDFLLFLQHYRPRISKSLLHLNLNNIIRKNSILILAEFDAMCTFKALHKDTESESQTEQLQAISREEFYSFYEVQGMSWKQVIRHT